MRRLTVEVEGGTAEEQADMLRSIAWDVEHLNPIGSQDNRSEALKARFTTVEMADYDHKLLAYAATSYVLCYLTHHITNVPHLLPTYIHLYICKCANADIKAVGTGMQ